MSVSRRARVAAVVPALFTLASSPARAFELADLFRTPEQRAAARFAAGEHEALVEDAPDARWEGIGRYAGGDAEGAAAAFARALEADAPSGPARDVLLYNRATAETRAGRLDTAIALYDELLERDPEHADARHNRDVARALKALDEQEGRSGEEGGDGERTSDQSGADGSEDPSEGGEQASENDAAEGGDESDGRNEGAADEAEAGESSNASAGDDGARDGEPSVAAIDEEEAAAARAAAEAALAAERERAGEEGDAATANAVAETRTPSEREQATEQWLRRIADDPAGLLRRRLERSHRGDYPEVGDGDEPW